MTSIAMDFARLSLAIILGGVSLALLRLAWQVFRYRPTQIEIDAERKRRALAGVFRSLSNRGQP